MKNYWDVLFLLQKQEAVVPRFIYALIGVSGFIFLTAVGALIRIPLPFTPVPITLQTFFVLLSGAFLGRRLGPLSQGGYVLLGVLGFLCSLVEEGISIYWAQQEAI